MKLEEGRVEFINPCNNNALQKISININASKEEKNALMNTIKSLAVKRVISSDFSEMILKTLNA